ncbi:unnamed protein product [Polarella glacialis]|uniref:Uncharacterized protein n=1 Tax=Polarella glacialis TaxID=89957 RepID=A0A813FDG3_POLGL|nr:unnamed protein product [Polarella glacialis]CAE8673793.1 unnamed protein product [Polarella glacialis]
MFLTASDVCKAKRATSVTSFGTEGAATLVRWRFLDWLPGTGVSEAVVAQDCISLASDHNNKNNSNDNDNNNKQQATTTTTTTTNHNDNKDNHNKHNDNRSFKSITTATSRATCTLATSTCEEGSSNYSRKVLTLRGECAMYPCGWAVARPMHLAKCDELRKLKYSALTRQCVASNLSGLQGCLQICGDGSQ